MTDTPVRFRDLIGLRFDPDRERAWLDIDARHMQGNGAVHGAVIHALLDTVMGRASYRALGDVPIATAEISVRYLLPAFEGRLIAEATVIKAGKRLAVVSGELRHGDDLIAIAQGTFVPVRPRAR